MNNTTPQPDGKSNTPTLDELAQIRYDKESLTQRKEALCRKHGWKHTSDTPGCYWMWQKKLKDGRTILVDTDTCLRFIEQLCGEEYPEL